jgi:hypothetical protein
VRSGGALNRPSVEEAPEGGSQHDVTLEDVANMVKEMSQQLSELRTIVRSRS